MTCDYCGSTEDVRHVELSAENICEACGARLTRESLEAVGGAALMRQLARYERERRECEAAYLAACKATDTVPF